MTNTRRGRAALICLFALALIGGALLWSQVLRVPCPILRLTGFYCAGCGGSRMLAALLRGDLIGAFRANPYLFCVLPPLGGYLLAEGVRYVQGKAPLAQKKPVLYGLLLAAFLAVIFTVLRNLPWFGFLAPR